MSSDASAAPEDDGQMMLLAAVVLVVAFLSLSVLVGRLSVIEAQTVGDSANPLLEHAKVVERGVCAILRGSTDSAPLLTNLTVLLGQTGILASFSSTGADGAESVTVRLYDGRSSIEILVRETTDC